MMVNRSRVKHEEDKPRSSLLPGVEGYFRCQVNLGYLKSKSPTHTLPGQNRLSIIDLNPSLFKLSIKTSLTMALPRASVGMKIKYIPPKDLLKDVLAHLQAAAFRESAHKRPPSTRVNEMLNYILVVSEAQAAVYKQVARALSSYMRADYMRRGAALGMLAGQ